MSSSNIRRLCKALSVIAGSILIDRSRQVLSSDRRTPDMEALLLRSALDWPRDESNVVLRERVNMLTLARDKLVLFAAATKPKDELEEELRR
jgi:hypothetical protein